MTLTVPDPEDVEVVPPNARKNPIYKVPLARRTTLRVNGLKKQWAYRCPVCGEEGRRMVNKEHHTKKGRSAPMQWALSSPLLTRKQAKDALVRHMKVKHKASPVGVRLR